MKKIGLILLLLTALQSAIADDRFLVLADMHYSHLAASSDYGTDTGEILWKQTLKKAAALIDEQKPKFILILGDLPSHSLLSYNREEDMKNVLHDLRTTLGKTGIPIYLVPGNNDYLGGDYHSFSDEKGRSLIQL